MLRVDGWGALHLLGDLWPGVTDVPWVAFAIYLVVSAVRFRRLPDPPRPAPLRLVVGPAFAAPFAAPDGYEPVERQPQPPARRRHARPDHTWCVAQLHRRGAGAVCHRHRRLHAASARACNMPICACPFRRDRGAAAGSTRAITACTTAIGIGHESNGPTTLGGHNFGVLLPWWDMLSSAPAISRIGTTATGIRDQVPHAGADGGVGHVRDYGRGFWAQQWMGLRRMVGR